MELTVTPKAIEKMQFYLQGKDLKEWGVRIVVRMRDDYSFSLAELNKTQDTDLLLEKDGVTLIIDDISQGYLDGGTVDFVESELSSGFKVEPRPVQPIAAGAQLNREDPVVQKISQILSEEINPSIAAHGGSAKLVAIENGVAYLEMGGGCQGCVQVDATLRQGIEKRIKELVPEIIAVEDATDHQAGQNPYFR